MFSRHYRKVKALFGLSDVVLVGLAFEAAYQTRSFLPFARPFFLDRPVKTLLLGAAVLIWLAIGLVIYFTYSRHHSRLQHKSTGA